MNGLKKYLAYTALGLLIYMPFHIFISQWLSSFTGGLDVWKIGKDVITAVLTLICVAIVLVYKKYTKLYLWLVGLTIGYAALHLIVLMATHQPLDTGFLATTYNVRLFCYALIGYSIALITPKIIKHHDLIKILLAVSTVVCMIAMLQWVLPKDIMTHFGYSVARGVKPAFFIDDKPDLPRVFSTLRDPNSLGAFLILPITLLAYGLLKFWRTNRRMLLGGLLLLHSLVLFLTFSRSAWLGTILALATLLFITKVRTVSFNKNLLKRYVAFGVVGLVILGGFVFVLKDQYVVQNVVFHSDESTRQTDSNNLHIQQIQKGIEGIAHQPLGHGPGTAGLVSIHNQSGGLLTENYFIQVAYEVGILGLVILVFFMCLVFRKLWSARNEPLVVALLASFPGLTLMNLLLHIWSNEAVASTWFLLAGYCLVRSKIPKKV